MWRLGDRTYYINSRNENYYPYCRYNGTSQLTNRFDQTTHPADMEHVMITGMNKEKTSKGIILGAYGRMIDIAVEIKWMKKLKEALVITATQDDTCRRSAIDDESQREGRRCGVLPLRLA